MIKAQEVETSIILFIHNGYKIESAKTHGRQLTILILLSFLFLHPNSTFFLFFFFIIILPLNLFIHSS